MTVTGGNGVFEETSSLNQYLPSNLTSLNAVSYLRRVLHNYHPSLSFNNSAFLGALCGFVPSFAFARPEDAPPSIMELSHGKTYTLFELSRWIPTGRRRVWAFTGDAARLRWIRLPSHPRSPPAAPTLKGLDPPTILHTGHDPCWEVDGGAVSPCCKQRPRNPSAPVVGNVETTDHTLDTGRIPR